MTPGVTELIAVMLCRNYLNDMLSVVMLNVDM
jgi:hypothetical protein